MAVTSFPLTKKRALQVHKSEIHWAIGNLGHLVTAQGSAKQVNCLHSERNIDMIKVHRNLII